MLKDYIKDLLGYNLTEKQNAQFESYYTFLVEYNTHTNLTRITTKKDAEIKHFLDSVLLARLINFDQGLRVCDMGAGAGFPSIPLLILYPDLKVTIVESQIKRVSFLNALKEKLNLEFEVVHERAEVFALSNQNHFDVVTARALGELNIILELGVPMLKVGGYFIAPKGSKVSEELLSAKNALNTLKLKLVKQDTFDLPEDSGFRSNLLFVKEKHVPGFPRSYAQIKKKPL